jgi:hypothetical protein
MSRHRLHLPLAGALALFLGACQDSSPTEPARITAATSTATVTAAAASSDDPASAGVEIDTRRGGPLARVRALAQPGEATGGPATPTLAVAEPGRGNGNGNARNGNGNGGSGGGAEQSELTARVRIVGPGGDE